jgi:hypothetical protein
MQLFFISAEIASENVSEHLLCNLLSYIKYKLEWLYLLFLAHRRPGERPAQHDDQGTYLIPDTVLLYIAIVGHATQAFPREHGPRGQLLCRFNRQYVGQQGRRSGWKAYKRKFIPLV